MPKKKAADPKPTDPWGFLSADALARQIDATLEPDPGEPPASGALFVPTQPVSILSAVRAATPVGRAQDLEDHLECSGMSGLQEVLWGFRAGPIIDCWVSDSMVSGSWSLCELRLDRRGYVYNQPDYGILADESLPILGAWEPVDDPVARRACILSVYEREWDNYAWPPYMGQWARGEPDLLQDAVLRVLRLPDMATPRQDVLDRLLHQPDSYAAVDEVARLNALAPDRIVQVLGLIASANEAFVARWKAGTSSDDEQRIVVGLFVQLLASGPDP